MGMDPHSQTRAGLPERFKRGERGGIILLGHLQEAHHVERGAVEVRITRKTAAQIGLGRIGALTVSDAPGRQAARDDLIERAVFGFVEIGRRFVFLAAHHGIHAEGKTHQRCLAANLAGPPRKADGGFIIACEQGRKHRPLGNAGLFRRRINRGSVIFSRRFRIIGHRGKAGDEKVPIGLRLGRTAIREERVAQVALGRPADARPGQQDRGKG